MPVNPAPIATTVSRAGRRGRAGDGRVHLPDTHRVQHVAQWHPHPMRIGLVQSWPDDQVLAVAHDRDR
jgi:WD40 repeat protein